MLSLLLESDTSCCDLLRPRLPRIALLDALMEACAILAELAVFLLATRWRARLGIVPRRRELRTADLTLHLAATGGYASPALAVVVCPPASIGAKGVGTSPLGQALPAHNTPSYTR
jgi:hypothetical protein